MKLRRTVKPADALNPKSGTAKQLEMSVRRCGNLVKLCALWTEKVGAAQAAVEPPGRSWREIEKLIQEVASAHYWSDPYWRQLRNVWPWVYQLWKQGSLQEHIDVVLELLPEDNYRRAMEKIT